MSDVQSWSTTASSNNSASPNGWPENMAPSGINNSARENMAAIAKWYADGNGSLSSGGSANAYTLSPSRTIAAYAAGIDFRFKANHTCTGASTVNVSSLGVKDIRDRDGAALTNGAIQSGSVIHIVYDATNGYFRATNVYSAQSTSLALDDLTDVAINTITVGDMLVRDTNDWINIQVRDAVPAATSGDAGISRFATNAESAALTSTTIGLTPGGLGSAVPATAAASGYQTLLGTNGIKIVWGSDSVSGGTGSLTFSSAFSSACYGVWLQITESSITDVYALKAYSVTTNGCTVRNTNAVTLTYTYVAIGK